jgi:hypothetical protein
VKAFLRIFRPSRKLVVVIGGLALLTGASGGAALYIGRDNIILRSVEEADGVACTDVNLVTIKKQDHVWIRKYIKTEPTDGMTRVKTALRVAQAVYQQQKPDLVQVVVLDEKGPTLRSDIRGRAIGADVVYIPQPDKMIEGLGEKSYIARYHDGEASQNGLFFGERIDLPEDQIHALNASLRESSDCIDPTAVASTTGDKPAPKASSKEEGAKEAPASSH